MADVHIDIVSDVVCPWCAVGYSNLKHAINEMENPPLVKIHWRAFELNPHMDPEGQDVKEHLMQKYGIGEAQVASNKQRLVQVGKDAGVDFNFDNRSRIYNTFDCHRLLHWAYEVSPQLQTVFKEALFTAYFTHSEDISNHQTLLRIVSDVNLSVDDAAKILSGDRYEADVRSEQSKYQQMGIQAVPAFIINEKFLINGGQPKEAFKEALIEMSDKAV